MNLLAILRQRCPRCLRAGVFKSVWTMHTCCPACELRFAREPGYFFGAMYFSYGLGHVAVMPLVIWMLSRKFGPTQIGWASMAYLTLLLPLLFRYSRILWLHFDHRWNPTDPTDVT